LCQSTDSQPKIEECIDRSEDAAEVLGSCTGRGRGKGHVTCLAV
jgi:hypothetical protein